MKVIILGGGALGYKVAKLFDNGNVEVTLIEENEKSCKELAECVNAKVIMGNGTEIEVLSEAGIKHADCFITVSGSDETNLLACLVAKECSKATLATRILNDQYRKIFEKAGVNIIVSPETAGAEELYKMIVNPDLSELGSDQKNLTLLDIMIKEKSKLNKKMVSEIGEGDDFRVVAIKKENEFVIPINETLILSGDRVIVVCKKGVVENIRNFFSK